MSETPRDRLRHLRQTILDMDPANGVPERVEALAGFADHADRLARELAEREHMSDELGVSTAELKRLRREMTAVAEACRRCVRADQRMQTAVQELQDSAERLAIADDDGDGTPPSSG